MNITIPGLTDKSENPFDRYVPIIQSKNITHVYITDEIAEPSAYNELCYALQTASPAETFHIYINTPGGVIDSAFQLTAAMKSSEATIIGHLSGTVASAGTLISLACDQIEVAPHTSFMAHNYSGGLVGKGGELKSRQKHVENSLEDAFRDFYSGFFTPDEIQEIIEDKDYWLGKDEVLERWENRQEYLKSKVLIEP
jgi:ATP-dependent protease ClpP protease subunit